jgi:hypothetical protein
MASWSTVGFRRARRLPTAAAELVANGGGEPQAGRRDCCPDGYVGEEVGRLEVGSGLEIVE